MKSIRDLYKVGKGPSSSHTMGPERAARIFKQENPGAERYEVTLYGSLALTGVGHGTDRVLSEVLAPTPTEIIFSKKDPGDLRHPNTLDFAAYKGEEKFASMRVESIGGGDIVIEGREAAEPDDVYPENSFAEIAQYCRWRYISLREYVELNEGPEIWDFLQTIWRTMRAEVEEGLEATGILPGGLNVQRKARYLYERQHAQEIPQVRELQLVCAYAFAAAEQNAANGTIVTAPTCGSCGVLPAVLMYLQGKYHYSDLRMAHALGVAGIIGNLIRRNASISGAECGCQAEIGSACSMAASSRLRSASARTRSLAAVICSLAVAVSSACKASACSLHWSVFSCAARQSFCSLAAFRRSSSISCLRVNRPALRCTLPPVKLPPALITCPSMVTTLLW